LVDFRYRQALIVEPGLTNGLTQNRRDFGSPPYMPPEQIEGRDLDNRSDIYSFGCVMYECLCARTPFQAPNAIRMILKHLDETPVPIDQLVKEKLSTALTQVVMECLEKQSHARPHDMCALAIRLKHCLLHSGARDYQ